MKFSATHAFVNQFVLGLLVTIGFGGSVGLGTVWMRHQVSVLADSNRELEQQFHETERRTDDLTAQIESQLSPDVLRHENEAMGLGLVPLTQAQISRVSVDPIGRLVAKANRRVFRREAAGDGIAVEFSLPTITDTGGTEPAADAADAAAPYRATNRIQFATNP